MGALSDALGFFSDALVIPRIPWVFLEGKGGGGILEQKCETGVTYDGAITL